MIAAAACWRAGSALTWAVAILAGPMANPYVKQYLMTAGPTPLPPAVSQVMAEPMLYHRAPAFVEVYARVLERLGAVFGTRTTCSCSRARAAARWSRPWRTWCAPGEPALVASCGKFGERWAELCDAYGAADPLGDGVGPQVDPAELDAQLAGTRGRARVHDAVGDLDRRRQRRARARPRWRTARRADRGRRGLGMGAVPCPQDEWGVDVVVAGSQKALMAPPGLGFASPNEAALERARPSGRAGATTSTGSARRRASARTRPTARSPRGRPRPGARRGARADRDRGRSTQVYARHGCSAAPRARPRGRSTSSCSATAMRTRTW